MAKKDKKEAKRPDETPEIQPGAEAQELTEEQRALLEMSDEERILQDIDKNRYLILRRVKLELKPGYVLRKVGQAHMVMPTGPRMKDYQGMITLNETGAFLYNEMQKPDTTEGSLEQACIDEYGATPEEAEKAVNLFVEQCMECGLLEYEEVIVDKETSQIVTKEEIDAQQQ